MSLSITSTEKLQHNFLNIPDAEKDTLPSSKLNQDWIENNERRYENGIMQ